MVCCMFIVNMIIVIIIIGDIFVTFEIVGNIFGLFYDTLSDNYKEKYNKKKDK